MWRPLKKNRFWYEVVSHNVPFVDSCHCTRYNFTLTGSTSFSDVFTCNKGSPSAKPFAIHNVGSFEADTPGKMVESLGPVSPPYWVLRLWGSAGKYDYSLVYACVGLLGLKAEYICASAGARTRGPFLALIVRPIDLRFWHPRVSRRLPAHRHVLEDAHDRALGFGGDEGAPQQPQHQLRQRQECADGRLHVERLQALTLRPEGCCRLRLYILKRAE
jgi:hypothetical protein